MAFSRMSNVCDTGDNSAGRPIPGLWFDDGLYYADVFHPAVSVPIRVVLHGIQNGREAVAALRALTGVNREGGSLLALE